MIRDRRGQVSPFPLEIVGIVVVLVFAIVAYEVVMTISIPTFWQQVGQTLFVTWRALLTFGTGDWRTVVVWIILSPILYPLFDAYVLQRIIPGPHY